MTTLQQGNIFREMFYSFQQPIARQGNASVHGAQRAFDLQVHDWEEVIRMAIMWNEVKR